MRADNIYEFRELGKVVFEDGIGSVDGKDSCLGRGSSSSRRWVDDLTPDIHEVAVFTSSPFGGTRRADRETGLQAVAMGNLS